MLSNGRGVIAGVHQIVQISHAAGAHRHQRNGHLRVMHIRAGQQSADRNLSVGDVQTLSIAAPVLLMSLAAFFTSIAHSCDNAARACRLCRFMRAPCSDPLRRLGRRIAGRSRGSSQHERVSRSSRTSVAYPLGSRIRFSQAKKRAHAACFREVLKVRSGSRSGTGPGYFNESSQFRRDPLAGVSTNFHESSEAPTRTAE